MCGEGAFSCGCGCGRDDDDEVCDISKGGGILVDEVLSVGEGER